MKLLKMWQKLPLVIAAGVVMAVMLGWLVTTFDKVVYAGDVKGDAPKQIVLKFAELEPPPSLFTKTREWWASEIERRTGGRLKIKIYPGGTLARPPAVIEAVRVGLADGGTVITVFNPGKTPLATVSQNPIGGSDIYVNHKAMQDIINNYAPIQKEFARFNQKALWTYATGSQRLISIKPVRNLDDIKGLKIRASAQMATLYKKLGADPVFIPMGETYEGLQRATAEAASAGLTHIKALRFFEVCKYLLLIKGIGVSNAGFGTINLDKWKMLPPDIQKVVLEVSNEYPAYLSERMIASEKKILKAFEAAGVKIYKLSAADKKRLQGVGKEVTEMWEKKMDKKGLPGSETLKVFLKTISKYQAEVDAKGYPWAPK